MDSLQALEYPNDKLESKKCTICWILSNETSCQVDNSAGKKKEIGYYI